MTKSAITHCSFSNQSFLFGQNPLFGFTNIVNFLFDITIFFRIIIFLRAREFFASVSVRKSVLYKSRLRVIIFRSQQRKSAGSRIHLLALDKGIRRMPEGGFSRDFSSKGSFRPLSLINPSFGCQKTFDPPLHGICLFDGQLTHMPHNKSKICPRH